MCNCVFTPEIKHQQEHDLTTNTVSAIFCSCFIRNDTPKNQTFSALMYLERWYGQTQNDKKAL